MTADLADDPRHPSRYAYVHLCRCALCTEENRVYMIGQRRRALERSNFQHGITGYRYGCRCETCRAAKAVTNAAANARRTASAS